jgi:hypothetical protein
MLFCCCCCQFRVPGTYSDVGHHLRAQDAPSFIQTYFIVIFLVIFRSVYISKVTAFLTFHVLALGMFSRARRAVRLEDSSPKVSISSSIIEHRCHLYRVNVLVVEQPLFLVDNIILWYLLLAHNSAYTQPSNCMGLFVDDV